MRPLALRSLVAAFTLPALASVGVAPGAFAQAPMDIAAGPMGAERIPERWKEGDALVVGQVAGTWQFGVATMGGKGLTTGVAVKGARPSGNGLFRGVILFTHREGEVTLSGAYASVGGQDQRLPIRRTFNATRGQVAVLGLLYFQKQAGTREGYQVLTFDNREETIDYLRRTYPQLVAERANAQFVLAPGDYLPMEKLVELRTSIAQTEARHAKRDGQFWVAGSAGTIARVKVTGDSVQVLGFLPPVTYHEPMLNSWDEQGVLTFSSATHRWRIVDDKVVEIPMARDTR